MLIITVKVDYWPFCGLLLTAFQAPEELKADAVNEGADIYAFGVLLMVKKQCGNS